MNDRETILETLLDAARAASEVVMRVYAEADVGAELKAPGDPVTRADREANQLLVDSLAREFPSVPIVAEESPPEAFAGFGTAKSAFFVDPLDGTREFIDRVDQFAVMIGYAEEGRATVGVVVCPARGETYCGIVGKGAFVIAKGERTPIRVGDVATLEAARIAVSRSHRSKDVEARLALLMSPHHVPMGSAGVKGAFVASQKIDVYAHPTGSPMKLWDACAPEAIVRAAGGVFTDTRGRPFDYRGPVAQGDGCLAANPVLHAEAVRRLAGAVGASS
jgi:3'(2'), 5'-bisphosphate nucleotidase